jgi:HPt (histidine-containing phosphotransfer) domain-containing protein
VAVLRSVFEDDTDMLEIVREFAAQLPQRARRIAELFEAGDLKGLGTLAHQLKGAGGGYGFPQLTQAAGELERAIVEGGAEPRIKERVTELCELLAAVAVPEAR